MPISCRVVVRVLDVDGVEHTSQRVIGDVSNQGLLAFFVILLYLSFVVNGACHRDLHLYNGNCPLTQLRWVFKLQDVTFIILEGGGGYFLQELDHVVGEDWDGVPLGRHIIWCQQY